MKKLVIICILLALQTACQNGETERNSASQTHSPPAASNSTLSIPTNPSVTAEPKPSDNVKKMDQEAPTTQDIVSRDGTVQVISDQSFETEFESWGKVKFESAKWKRANGRTELLLQLIGINGQTLYTFPVSELTRSRDLLGVNAVSFKDVDGDGKKDVIVIANYSSTKDQSGKDKVTLPAIFIQTDKDFVPSKEIEYVLYDQGNATTVSNIVSILKQEGNQSLFVKDKVNYSLCKRVRASNLSEDDVIKIYTDEYGKQNWGGGEQGEDRMFGDIGRCFSLDTHERLATNSLLQSQADTLFTTVTNIASNLFSLAYISNGGGTMWVHLGNQTYGITGYRINHYIKMKQSHPGSNPKSYKQIEEKLITAVQTLKQKEPKDANGLNGETGLNKAKAQYKDEISKLEKNIQALSQYTAVQDEASVYLLQKVADQVANFDF